jgi:hypothetical protein
LAEHLLDFSLACIGCLPPIEPNCANNFVDVIHDAPNHYRGLSILGILEKICESNLATIDVLFDGGLAFHFNDVHGELVQFFQQISAEKQSLLMPVSQIFEPFGQCLVLRIASVLSKATCQLDRDFPRLFVRVGIAENRFRSSASITMVSRSSHTASTRTFSWISSMDFAPRRCHSRRPVPVDGFNDSYT